MQLYELPFAEIRRGLADRDFSSRELTESVLERIGKVEPRISAYITVCADEALAAADRVDSARAAGDELGPLAGVPIAVKDNISTLGVRTTCASRILETYVPPFDATAVKRLIGREGAVLVGKTNMDEFAMGSSNENSAFGVTRNPWGLERVPGGSSGGSCAAVAAGEAALALGSDTGGSVRQPAGFCGTVGVKPSYGRVSRYGLVAFASSLDQICPVSRDVEGAAVLLGAIAGEDSMDSTTSAKRVPDYTESLRADLSGFSIGVAQEFFGDGLDSEVDAAVGKAIDVLAGCGASVRDVSLPHAAYGIAAYYLIANAEASSNLSRYDGVRYGFRAGGGDDLYGMYVRTRSRGFGREVKRRIMLGTYALSAGYYDDYYLKAQRVRSLIAADMRSAFQEVDAIVVPTSPTAAFRIGERIDDPLKMYLADVYTIQANLAGIAAASVPCGVSREGLPIGLQIMADVFCEDKMFQVAYAYEQAAGFPRGMPL